MPSSRRRRRGSGLGAMINSFNDTIELNIETTEKSKQPPKARIRDVDIAKEND